MAENQQTLCESIRAMRWCEWVLMVVLTIIPEIGGAVGAATISTGAYKDKELISPDWGPPPWLFGPVWFILYLMMGFSSFLIWKIGGGFHSLTIPALLLYIVQLLLNWSWTPAFFGFGNLCAGLVIISMMDTLVVSCLVTFTPISKVAALLLLPYMAWLSFASALNYSIVGFNGCFMNHNSTSY